MTIEPKLTPAVEAALIELRQEHLYDHPIWDGKFFTAIKDETDQAKVVAFLREWILQMPHASYGFTTYVAHLMARTDNEMVRYLLSSNEREELGYVPKDDGKGVDTYPYGSHFQMICKLNQSVGNHEVLIAQGLATEEDFTDPDDLMKFRKFRWQDHARLLPDSRAHVKMHTDLCRDGDFVEGLGTLFLIENLTAKEFGLVLDSCQKNWPEGGTHSKALFADGGGGGNYFRANMEADGEVEADKPFAGHSLEAAFMLQADMATRGIDINDPEAIKPYMEKVAAGMQKSITCRMAFVEGVHEAVVRRMNGIPVQGSREEVTHMQIQRPEGLYLLTALLNNQIEIAKDGKVITFQVVFKTAEVHQDETIHKPEISADAQVKLRVGGETQKVDLLQEESTAALARDFALVAKRCEKLSEQVKLAFGRFEQQLPKVERT